MPTAASFYISVAGQCWLSPNICLPSSIHHKPERSDSKERREGSGSRARDSSPTPRAPPHRDIADCRCNTLITMMLHQKTPGLFLPLTRASGGRIAWMHSPIRAVGEWGAVAVNASPTGTTASQSVPSTPRRGRSHETAPTGLADNQPKIGRNRRLRIVRGVVDSPVWKVIVPWVPLDCFRRRGVKTECKNSKN